MMVAATDANSVDRIGFGPAAPSRLSHALRKPRAVLTIKVIVSLAGAQSSVGRQASVEHGLLRSTANPGKVFGNAPAGCGCAVLSRRLGRAVWVSEVAPLWQREHSVLQLRWTRFDRRPSCARARSSWCQGAEAASMRSTQAVLTWRSSGRREGCARFRSAVRAAAQRRR
jgi:hypothetical protein